MGFLAGARSAGSQRVGLSVNKRWARHCFHSSVPPSHLSGAKTTGIQDSFECVSDLPLEKGVSTGCMKLGQKGVEARELVLEERGLPHRLG